MRTCALLAVVSGAVLLGCSTAQVALKGPISDRCSLAGLQECSKITTGALAYMNGDWKEGEAQLRSGASANSPTDVHRFAASLDTLSTAVGGDAGKSMQAVADILRDRSKPVESSPHAEPVRTAAATSPGPPVKAPSSAIATPDRSRPQTSIVQTAMNTPVTDSFARSCDPVLSGGLRACVALRAAAGPFILTSLYTSGGCPDELFVSSSGEAGGPRWTMLLPVGEKWNVSGQFHVDGVAGLWIGARGPVLLGKNDGRCSVVWSGYRLSPPEAETVRER